jgi:rhodanese-related sulfurtransferase
MGFRIDIGLRRGLVLAFICLIPLGVFAEQTFAKPDGVETLDAEALIRLAQTEEDLIVIDARLAEDLKMGYIGGSLNLPDILTNCETLNQINPDFNRSMAFYCNGTVCKRSVHALQIARQCGYHRLFWFKGGFEEWRNKDYPYVLD